MPIKMGLTLKSIVINDVLYVGGGYAAASLEMCTVMKYDLKQSKWSKLPLHNTVLFAMTSLFNQLVLVGGDDPATFIPTRQLAMLDSVKWTSLKPMNTARSCGSAVSYDDKLVIAGGYTPKHNDPCAFRSEYTRSRGGYILSNSVEIFDSVLEIWYPAKPLPIPCNSPGLALVGDSLYVMGGQTDSTTALKLVYKADLKMLIHSAISKTTGKTSTTMWHRIANTFHELSVPLSSGGSLYSFGGCVVSEHDDLCEETDMPASAICLYQPDSNRWVKVGDLPTARYGCACSVLPTGDIIVAGGFDGKLICAVDFFYCSS